MLKTVLNLDHSIFGFVSANFIKSGDIRVSNLLNRYSDRRVSPFYQLTRSNKVHRSYFYSSADFLQMLAEGIGRIFAAFFQIFIKSKLLRKGFSGFNVFGLALFGFR